MSTFSCSLRVYVFILVSCSVTACNQSTNPNIPGIWEPLLIQLNEINGKYVWNKDLKQYYYTDKIHIEKILSSKNTEPVIHILINCLDNFTLSNSTINEKKVVLAIICYEALSQTIYYEHTTAQGDIAKHWSGHLLPTANKDDLFEAKRAWKLILDSKSYIVL